MEKGYYQIDGHESKFSTIREVREHIWAYSEKDKNDMDGVLVFHIYKGEVNRVREISIKNGKVIIKFRRVDSSKL